VWGDLREPVQIAGAVHDQDVVIHLAFIIPKLSVTGISSEGRPDFARRINVGGTANLLKAMGELARPPAIVFASSQAVYGRTQDLPPCRTADDPVCPADHYAQHKVECEELVRASGLRWTILRFAAVLPLALRLDPGLFDVPLDNRVEFVHTYDVGLALANALTPGPSPKGRGAGGEGVWDRTLLIGGGPACQFTYGEMVGRILDDLGVGMLPAEAFSLAPFCTDWLDTAESQRLLHYQQHDLDDYIREMHGLFGFKRHLVRAFRPLARAHLLRLSPYYRLPTPRRFWQALFGRPASAIARL